jgi:hypothetical protein
MDRTAQIQAVNVQDRGVATMRQLRNWAAALAMATATMGGAPTASAAACAGFTDVDSASAFCPNVEWLKNRAITTGCTSSTLYCPTDAVSRLAMAAFMNRLGTALTPTQLRVDTAPGAIDLDVNAVVCQTADFAVASFPRRAYVDLTLNATATADVGLAADVVQSTNAGATWTALNTGANRGSVAANQWGGLTDINGRELFTVIPLMVLTLFIGVYPKPLNDLMNATLTYLVQLMGR